MMINGLLITFLVLHGLIHSIALGRAYGVLRAAGPRMGRVAGWQWASAAVLFHCSAVMRFLHDDRWWMLALPAVVISQVLIARRWSENRFGTIANILITVAVVLGAMTWSFRREYAAAVAGSMRAAGSAAAVHITEADLAPLPVPAQRYLRAAGVVGTMRPRVLRMAFKGEIRSKDGPWMPFTSTQVNTFDPPTRSFWMDATMKGLPTKAWHWYDDGTATMVVKVLGAVPVLDVSGPQLDTTETVTWFNDLCLYAPAALLDPRITWRAIDDRQVHATFSHKGITVRAVLVFDEHDRLVDFLSDDRSYLRSDGTLVHHRFSTPTRDHRSVDGVLLPGYGEAIWHLPDGPFVYGRFRSRVLEYDPTPGK